MSYGVDTSALLDVVRYYPLDVFKSVWKGLDLMVKGGQLRAIDEVAREIEKKDDELHKWVSQRPDLFIPMDTSIQARAQIIINRFPSLTNTKTVMSGAADPFVIALAIECQRIVITAEDSKLSKPRIPDVCKTLGVECGALVDKFRREGWQI